jgi:hypothetical protein
MPIKKEIIYPIFLECCQYADDIFWENIFEDLSYGKAPYGSYISKGFLCCSYKNKEFSYKIERKEPKILYDDIYKLLTEKIGILSHKEKAKKKLDFHELEKNIKESRQDWASIRRKNVKDVMFEKYVIEMKYKYSLSSRQCRYLLSVIMLSLMFKTLSSRDIEYRDNKIHKIEGIDFTKGKIILQKSFCLNEGEKCLDVVEVCENDNRMFDNWDKFLKNLREK